MRKSNVIMIIFVMMTMLFGMLSITSVNAVSFTSSRSGGVAVNSFAQKYNESNFIDITNKEDATFTFGPAFSERTVSMSICGVIADRRIKTIDAISNGEKTLNNAYFIVNKALVYKGKYYDVKTTYNSLKYSGSNVPGAYMFLYTDVYRTCTGEITNHPGLFATMGLYVAATDQLEVNAKVEIFEHGTNTYAWLPKLGMWYVDVDGLESYISPINLTSSNTYVVTDESVKYLKYNATTRELYDSNGLNYDENGNIINLNDAHVFVLFPNQRTSAYQITENAAIPGNMGMQFRLLGHKVTYKSDVGGTITGITTEKVADQDNPSGTTQALKSGYCNTLGWKADKNVVLKDGTSIARGTMMTSSQVQDVLVTDDYEFTVYHEKCLIPTKSYASDTPSGKDSNAVTRGDIIKYSIKYVNDKDSSQAVIITDTLSNGLTYVSESAKVGNVAVTPTITNNSDGTTKLVFTRTLGSKIDEEITYNAKVTGIGTTVKNNAKMRVGNNPEINLGELSNPVPTKNYANDTPNGANNAIVKKNDTIKYSIKYSNPSNEDKTVRIVDTISKGLSYVASSGKVNNVVVNVSTVTNASGQTVITMTKSIAAGATEEFTYNAKVTGETSMVNNNATIKYNSMPEINLDELRNPVPSKEYASDTLNGKNGAAVANGSTIKYSIKYANIASSVQTVTIKDTISEGLTYVSGSAKVGSTTITPTVTNNSDGTTTLVFTKNINSSTSEELTYSVKVNGKETVVKNKANIKYGNGPEVVLNELKNPVPSKSYSTSTSAGAGNTEVKNGDKIKYSIKYANMTNSSSTVTIRDTLSKGLSYVSGSAKVGSTALTPTVTNNSDGTTTLVFTKSISSLASEELVYETKVNGAATLVQNGATIKYGNDSEIILNELKNAVPTKEYNPDTPSGLNGDVVKKGDTINYVIKYANAYSTNQTVVITDTISKGLTYVSGSAKIGSTSVNPTITSNSDGSTKMVWTKTVTSGTVEELKYSVKVTGEKVVVQNSANIKFGSNPLVDLNKLKNPVPSKNYASDTPAGANNASVSKGDIIKYNISYANVFTNNETVVITDTLSKGISYVSGSAKVGNAVLNPTITNNSDGTTKLVFTKTVASGVEEALTYSAKVDGGVREVQNNAKIKYNSTGTEIPLAELKNPVPSKDYASDSPNGKDNKAVKKGETIKYSIKYGDKTGSNQTVTIKDTLSKGLSYVSGSAKVGSTVINPTVVNNTDGTTVLTWTKTLNANAQEELTYSVKATGEATIVNNKAKIKIGNNPDINLDELKNTVPSKSYASDTPNGANNRAVKIGEQIKYSIKYANTTGSSQTVVITDKISKGLELVNGSAKVGSTTITPTKTVNSDGTTTLVFTKTVANNAQEELTYNVKVTGGVPIVNNNASIKYGNDSEIVLNMLKNPVPDKAYASDSPSGKNGAEVAEGDKIKYSIKYSNVKSGTDAVVITDTLSIGLEYVSGSAKIGNTSVTPTVVKNSDKTTTITISKSLAGNTTEELTYEALVVGDVSRVENNASIKYNNDPEIALTKLLNPLVPSTEIPNVGTKISIIGTITGLALVGFGGYIIYKRKHIRRYT